MAYPPELPPTTRTNSTVSAVNHAQDHNKSAAALRDFLEVLGADPAGGYATLTARLGAMLTDEQLVAFLEPEFLPRPDGSTTGQVLVADPSVVGGVKWSDAGGAATYEHPRGPSERAGNLDYTIDVTNRTIAHQQLITNGATFNQITMPVSQHAAGTREDLRVRVYETDAETSLTTAAAIAGNANARLKADATFPGSIFALASTNPGEVVLSFPQLITIAPGKFCVVAITSTAGRTVTRYWRDDTATGAGAGAGTQYTDLGRRRFYLWASGATAASLSNYNYLSGAFRLGLGDPAYVAINAQAIIAASAALAAQQAAENLDVSDEVTVAYTPTRGDAELEGSTNYAVAGFPGFAVQQLIPAAARFNELTLRVGIDPATPVTLRLYEAATGTALNASFASATPLHTQEFAAGELGPYSTIPLTTITLDDTVSVAAGKYLVALFTTPTNSKVAIRYYATNPDSDRPPFYLQISGTSVSASGTNYYSPGFKLALATSVSRVKAIAVQALADAATALEQGAPSPDLKAPPTLYAVTGDTLQVFVRGIIEAMDPYGVPYTFVANKGSAFPRFFEWTPAIGDANTELSLTSRIYKLDGTTAREAITAVKVKAPASPASPKRIMPIGDSLTTQTWPAELRRRLIGSGGTPAGAALGNIDLLGQQPIAGAAAPAGYFGYGGWTMATWIGAANLTAYWLTIASHDKDATDQKAVYRDGNGKDWIIETIEAGRIKVYASTAGAPPASGTMTRQSGGTHNSNITYTAVAAAASTPFWNPAGAGSFSLKYWCDTYAGGIYPDVIPVLLGWNGMPTGVGTGPADHAATIAHNRTFLDKVKAEFPAAKVLLMGLEVPSPKGGLGTNYGATGQYADYYQLLRKVHGYNLALRQLAAEAAYSAMTSYVDLASVFDSENNMPATGTPPQVNTRNTATEVRQTNGIHPADAGALQIADAAYRAVIHHL